MNAELKAKLVEEMRAAGWGDTTPESWTWQEAIMDTALDAVLCTITCSNPAFGAASGATAALLSVPLSGTVTAGGTVSKFRFTTGVDVTIIEGSVGTSGQDINLSSVVVSINDVIQLDSISYTAAV